MRQFAAAEDSSDVIENFTSSQWGKGTTEFVAKHYKTAQLDRNKDNDLAATKGKNKTSTSPSRKGGRKRSGNKKTNEKVTSEDLKNLIIAMENARDLKKKFK